MSDRTINRTGNQNMLQKCITLPHSDKIEEFNQWRYHNPTLIPDISNQNLSRKDLSKAYLRGVYGARTNLSGCNLCKVNLVQAEFTEAVLEEANLSHAMCMFSNIERV